MTLAERLTVYFICDPEHLGAAAVETVASAISGGATAIQLRSKSSTTLETLALARHLRMVTQDRALFIVNDRADIAVACGADGVHVGPNDLPVEDVKRFFPGLIVGGSANSIDRARALEALGADYLGCGAVFDARAVKPDATSPQGVQWLAHMAEAITIPFVGIGGITVENAASVISAGACGVAVVREIGSAASPARAATRLAEAVARGFAAR